MEGHSLHVKYTMEGQSLHLKCTMEALSLHIKCTVEGLSLHLKCTMEGPWVLKNQCFGAICKTQRQPQLNLTSTKVRFGIINNIQHLTTTHKYFIYTRKKSSHGLKIAIASLLTNIRWILRCILKPPQISFYRNFSNQLKKYYRWKWTRMAM